MRCLSLIVAAMHGYNMVCPVSMAEVSDEGKFEGATVIEPHRGAYWGPVAVLDYASLAGPQSK